MSRKRGKKVVEAGARKVRLKTSIQHVILHTVAAAGLLSVALLAPNALQVLRMFDRGRARRMNPKYLFAPAFQRLLMKGLVVFEEGKHGKSVRLTEAGEYELARMVARRPDTRTHRRWDGRWRLVIYDIREERTWARVQLRELLRTYGFHKLQNSVWVYPYDCEALVILLKSNFKIGWEALYLVVEKIEGDELLKKHFGLK